MKDTFDCQDVFNKVATHLFTQGKRAFCTTINTCMYRVKEIVVRDEKVGEETVTLKCAVGILIPDDKYDPKMETKGICRLSQHFPELAKELFGIEVSDDYNPELRQVNLTQTNYRLLERLQSVHDHEYHWDSTEIMRQELRKVASAFELDASILDTLSFKDR